MRVTYKWEGEKSFVPQNLTLEVKRFDSVLGMNDFLTIVGASYSGKEEEWFDWDMGMDLDWWGEARILKQRISTS